MPAQKRATPSESSSYNTLPISSPAAGSGTNSVRACTPIGPEQSHRYPAAAEWHLSRMEKLGVLGEGTYGIVLKYRHTDTGQVVAVKKVKEISFPPNALSSPQWNATGAKKTALREAKLLRILRHDNVIRMFDAQVDGKGCLYLVLEYISHTLLDFLERYPKGMPQDHKVWGIRRCVWQVLKGVTYLHSAQIIHRDIKPENILISDSGVSKLCDFGFARRLSNAPGSRYTDYVATRWYRAPELLVGDRHYSKPVDIWAIGCVFSEMLTGQALFPGDSDLDQLCRVIKFLGPLPKKLTELFLRNPYYKECRLPDGEGVRPTTANGAWVSGVSPMAIGFLKRCLIYEPLHRSNARQLQEDAYFHADGWAERIGKLIAPKVHDTASGLRHRSSAFGPDDRRTSKKARTDGASFSNAAYYLAKARAPFAGNKAKPKMATCVEGDDLENQPSTNQPRQNSSRMSIDSQSLSSNKQTLKQLRNTPLPHSKPPMASKVNTGAYVSSNLKKPRKTFQTPLNTKSPAPGWSGMRVALPAASGNNSKKGHRSLLYQTYVGKMSQASSQLR